MFMGDTGSVEPSSYKKYLTERVSAGECRSDGRRGNTDVRIPSTVVEPNTEASSSASSGPSGLLSSLMYTDSSGTCLQCEVHGYFGPPPLRSRKEGRLTVHVHAPFFAAHGGDSVTGGGIEMLRGNTEDVLVCTGGENTAHLQLEGFLSSILHRCIDLRQLGVLEGEACWVLTLSIMLVNADGGLFGACLAGALAVLNQLQLPRSLLPNGDVVEAKTLQLSRKPLACTYGLVTMGEVDSKPVWLADLTSSEELIVNAHLTITLTEEGEVFDVRQHGSMMGQEGAVMEHWRDAQKKVRVALGWVCSDGEKPASTKTSPEKKRKKK